MKINSHVKDNKTLERSIPIVGCKIWIEWQDKNNNKGTSTDTKYEESINII